ncbi:MAG: methyltransferase, partial [Fuerstiella sp.]
RWPPSAGPKAFLRLAFISGVRSLAVPLAASELLPDNVTAWQQHADLLKPDSQAMVPMYAYRLAANSTGVLEMVERLTSNRPAGLGDDGDGAAFIYRDGMKSAMEKSRLAEHFTLALAGRAKNVAPALADVVPLHDTETLLDVGGGTGIYSIGFLRKNPQLTATVLDRPEVLKTAEKFAQEYDVSSRIKLLAGDMFSENLPNADVVLLSNILHDWDVPECRDLVRRCAEALNPGGRLIIHDVLLNDELDGPLPIALYSAALFTLTEGRAYSAAEYSSWMQNAGLVTTAPVSTLIHCFAMAGTKP